MAATVQAIVLAAGASRRLGRPKALGTLPGGETALGRILQVLADAGVTRGAVVLGADPDGAIGREASRGTLTLVTNDDPDAGRTGSLQAGLRSLPDDTHVLLWPVDRPLAHADTVRALLEVTVPSGSVAKPVYEGRGGHPVLLGPGLRGRLLAAASDASLRDLLAPPVGEVRVPVEDPDIHANLDTEADWRARGAPEPPGGTGSAG